MNIDEMVDLIAPSFPNCPYPTVKAAVRQIYSEMEQHNIEYPEDFPPALEYGAKWKLYSMKSGRWYDPQEAAQSRALYVDARHRARIKEAQDSDDFVGYSSVPNF